jgi:hypothetical protein
MIFDSGGVIASESERKGNGAGWGGSHEAMALPAGIKFGRLRRHAETGCWRKGSL